MNKDSFKTPIAILKFIFDVLYAFTNPDDPDYNNEDDSNDDEYDYGWSNEYDDDDNDYYDDY